MKISLPAGIFGGVLLITYFLIIRALGYHTEPSLRYVNFILVIPVAIYSIHKYVTTAHSKTYLMGITVSFTACFTAYVVLGLFMVLYLFFDTDFLTFLYENSYPQVKLTKLSIFLLLIFEGGVGGMIISFVTMQFFKDRIRRVA